MKQTHHCLSCVIGHGLPDRSRSQKNARLLMRYQQFYWLITRVALKVVSAMCQPNILRRMECIGFWKWSLQAFPRLCLAGAWHGLFQLSGQPPRQWLLKIAPRHAQGWGSQWAASSATHTFLC